MVSRTSGSVSAGLSRLLIAAFVAVPVTAWPAAAIADCGDLLPGPTGPIGKRPAAASDILMLRDIGLPDGSDFNQPSPLAVSPDGRTVAFVLNRADPGNNGYCRGLVLVDLKGRRPPRLVDRGGEFITNPLLVRGVMWPGGFPPVITPVWSPDGRSVAYLRRDHGRTQVWRAPVNGSGARMVTQSSVDVTALAWSRRNGRIVYASHPGSADLLAAIDREGKGGWLYDARFVPSQGGYPLPAPAPRILTSIDAEGLDVRVASTAEAALVPADGSDAWALPSARAVDGRLATFHRSRGAYDLTVTTSTGGVIACTASACSGSFTGIWWDADGKDLLFLRREGWALGAMALYRWHPASKAPPRRVLHTTDVLQGCIPAGEGLLCLRESATRPRRISMIDPRDGHEQMVFDPNPEFANIAFGKVQRLQWTNDVGIEGRGDLVLPPDYRPGTRLPMIVVQYHSDGFLRGGTGDEYPIHALSAAGFAVLSLENVAFVSSRHPELATARDAAVYGQTNWAERRSQLSSLETGVRRVIQMDVADPARIGLTGLSDGSSSTRFALINSKLFAAAAISTCCVDSESVTTYGGMAITDDFTALGYPAYGKDAGEFWKPYSLTVNAKRITQPILMQLADDEYLTALQPFTALRAAGKPVEMYVYPNEHHIKWQSAHRAAIYQRNIDWFAFWLQNKIDDDRANDDQYRRWIAMRDNQRPRLWDISP